MNAALRMRAIIMVKIRLIVKRGTAQARKPAGLRGYFRLAFILSKCRAVMVNAFTHSRITRAHAAYEPSVKPLSLQQFEIPGRGVLMPKQRKIFRIEEMGRGEIPSEGFAETAEHASRHAELMTELRALRAMMANGKPVAAGDAPAQEANAVALKVQAKLKSQFDVIEQAFKKTKDDIVSLESTGLDGGQVARIRQELAAVKEGTTDATDRILKSAETIEQGASTLVAALKGGHEQGLAQDIQDQVTQIFEACNFHDLTSQRISKVVSSLTLLEDHIAQMVQIWNAIERFTNYVGRLTPPDGDGFLNGPKLDGDEGHASQNDIDALFH